MNRIFLIILGLFFVVNSAFAQILHDELIEKTLKGKSLPQIETNTNYNYENTDRVLIKLQIDKDISANKDIQEGDILKFYVKQDVKYKRKTILKMDTIATGRVKSFTSRGLNGIPGQIIVDDFKIPGIDSNKLKSTYIKRGIDLTVLVLPIKWALTPIPFVGSTTNLIIGGNAKITRQDTIQIYYYPNWNVI